MHLRNIHKHGYDFKELVKCCPALKQFVTSAPNNRQTINFSDPVAVKTLNQALLASYYKVTQWELPAGYLCPPIPGRADYIHHIADLLSDGDNAAIPQGKEIVGLDIGVGANVIYPIVGNALYGWRFVGSEVDSISLKAAKLNIKATPRLQKNVEIRQQANKHDVFAGIIKSQDRFAFTMCNPPFHRSEKEAAAGSQRKNRNLARNRLKRSGKPSENRDTKQLNFGGQHNELWCVGGELNFIETMIKQSVAYTQQVGWFTSLVSKKENVNRLRTTLEHMGCQDVKVVEMAQGTKISRIIAWRFRIE